MSSSISDGVDDVIELIKMEVAAQVAEHAVTIIALQQRIATMEDERRSTAHLLAAYRDGTVGQRDQERIIEAQQEKINALRRIMIAYITEVEEQLRGRKSKRVLHMGIRTVCDRYRRLLLDAVRA